MRLELRRNKSEEKINHQRALEFVLVQDEKTRWSTVESNQPEAANQVDPQDIEEVKISESGSE